MKSSSLDMAVVTEGVASTTGEVATRFVTGLPSSCRSGTFRFLFGEIVLTAIGGGCVAWIATKQRRADF